MSVPHSSIMQLLPEDISILSSLLDEQIKISVLNGLNISLKCAVKGSDNVAQKCRLVNYLVLHSSYFSEGLIESLEILLDSSLNYLIENFPADCEQIREMVGNIFKHIDVKSEICEKYVAYINKTLESNLENSCAECNSDKLLYAIALYVDVCPERLFNCPHFTRSLVRMTCVIPIKCLIEIIPKLLKLQRDNDFVRSLWSALSKLSLMSEENLNRILTIICLLGSSYITTVTSSSSFSLFDDFFYWRAILVGITSKNCFIRKQSLYLLKWSVSVLGSSDKSVNMGFMIWSKENNNDLTNSFERLIIVLETLEQGQIHIIAPSFQEINKLKQACSDEILHPIWLFSVFAQLFNQDSIVLKKLSISSFTDHTIIKFLHINNNDVIHDYYKNVIRQFCDSLNNMLVYSQTNNCEICICNSLKHWFCSLEKKIFSDVLECISFLTWGPIPLFHLVSALSEVPEKRLWGNDSLELLREFISRAIKTQTVIIRGGIQCQFILCLTKLTSSDISLVDLARIMIVFRKDESLRRGSGCWEICMSWMKSFITEAQLEAFFVSNLKPFLKQDSSCDSISPQAIARFIVLLHDAGILSKSIEFTQILNKIFLQLKDCEKRLYSSMEKQNNSVKFLYYLLDELEGDFNFFCTDKFDIINCPDFHYLICFFKLRLKTLSDFDEIYNVKIYLEILNLIFKNYKQFTTLDNVIKSLYHSVHQSLKDNILNTIQEIFALGIVKILHQHSYLSIAQQSLLGSEMIEFLKVRLLKTPLPNRQMLSKDAKQNEIGKLFADHTQSIWACFSVIISQKEIANALLTDFSLELFIREALEALNMGGKGVIIFVLDVFCVVLPYCLDIPETTNFICSTWKLCFELRKSELFWQAIDKWTGMVFQEKIIENDNYTSLLIKYGGEIISLGNDVLGLANVLIKHLQKTSCFISLKCFTGIIVDCLLFGPLLRKDQRIEAEICHFIESNPEKFTRNRKAACTSSRSSIEVRLIALNIIINKNTVERENIIPLIVKTILEKDENSLKKNKRYFNDSLVHRRKHRSLQILLILQDHICKHYQELSEVLFEWVVEALLTESHQPSVRYQLEWLSVLLMINKPSFKAQLWSIFDQASQIRLGSLCSFIGIGYHLAKVHINNDFFEEFVCTILPLCMSQNFNIRLYSQVALDKLWPLYKFSSNKFDVLEKTHGKIFGQGNMACNAKKMQADFYFDAFHPCIHYNVQTLIWDLPRLSNISQEEWIALTVFKQYVHLDETFISLGNEKSELSAYDSPLWLAKTSDVSTMSDDDYYIGIQKKFVPWKRMFPEYNLEQKDPKKKGELILITSLIDKLANLGGLARTSEIFGVKELVLSSIEFVKDKGFTSLSMTAEKHLSITEVKPHNLIDYLKNLKENGYALIGSEQTTNSIPINNYIFPYKTALVLGNEREGIQADILTHLDACVEIPQFGLIRSLNVHVSGSVMLWEYAKQHLQNESILKT